MDTCNSSQLHTAIFTKAVQSVVKEGRFHLPTPQSMAALSTASAVIRWCEDPTHSDSLAQFAHELSTKLGSCFSHHLSLRLKKERMWGLYHQLSTSAAFKGYWAQFLQGSV